MDGRDRRKFPRFEGEFPVDLLNMGDDPAISTLEPVVRALALDVSRQGIRLQSNYNVGVGAFISAIVYYQDRDSLALCEVMWKRQENGQFLYGLYIKEWSKIDQSLDKQLSCMQLVV